MRKNFFIALEGIDGSGKSTQAKLLSQRLANLGHKVYETCEPTKGPIGTMIRNILTGQTKADERVVAGLFVADRLDHLLNEANGIVKKLEAGYTVITDRYYFSSYAYNGTQTDLDWVIKANAMSARILKPDVNIFIDVSPETAMQRLKNRHTIELYETLENLKKVKATYFAAFSKLKQEEKVSIINGNRSIEAISNDIWNEVEKLAQPQ